MVKRHRIAIVPARGGSKRLPRKNLLEFFGKPLMAWSFEAGLESGLFDRVVVSTEDPEIADIARLHGADVPFLREAYADDKSTVSNVTVHAVQQAEKYLDETFDTVVMLQATCPLRDANDVKAAVQIFESSKSSFQMSCFQFHWANPWWTFQRKPDGTAEWAFPEMIERRSQDQPPAFGLTGAICIAKVDALLRSGTFYGPGQRFEPISWISAVDIDDEVDMAFARAAYQVKQKLPK